MEAQAMTLSPSCLINEFLCIGSAFHNLLLVTALFKIMQIGLFTTLVQDYLGARTSPFRGAGTLFLYFVADSLLAFLFLW